jgi:hypothetical protein
MELSKVQQIERAIGELTAQELDELYSWLDEFGPNPIDTRVRADLDAGRLDKAIQQALDLSRDNK